MRWTAWLFVVVLVGVLIEVFLVLFVVGRKPVATYIGGFALPDGTMVYTGYSVQTHDHVFLTLIGRVVRVYRTSDNALIDVDVSSSLTNPVIQPMRVAMAGSTTSTTLLAESVNNLFLTQHATRQQNLDMTNAVTALQPLVGSEVVISVQTAQPPPPPPGVYLDPAVLRLFAQALPCNQRLAHLLTDPTGKPITCQPLISQIMYYAKR